MHLTQLFHHLLVIYYIFINASQFYLYQEYFANFSFYDRNFLYIKFLQLILPNFLKILNLVLPYYQLYNSIFLKHFIEFKF